MKLLNNLIFQKSLILILLFTSTIFLTNGCKDENPVNTPTTGTIQGKVTNATGDSVISGATVTTSPPTSSVTTNAAGEYTISDVSPGQYSVTAIKGGYNTGSVSISVAAGKTTTANIPLNLISVSTGLIAYYPFNGNANDESGNGYNGSVVGAFLTQDRFSQINRAYSFNGAGNFISTNFAGILGNQPRTISLWMKKNSSSTFHMTGLSYGHIMTPLIRGSAFICYLYFNNSLTVGIDVQDGAIRYDAPNDDNNWHHYIWVVPNLQTVLLKDVKLYQDGIQLTTAVDWWNSQSYSENTVLNTLTGQNLSLGLNCNAFLDDVRIYNRALSDSEIQALYHEGGWQ